MYSLLKPSWHTPMTLLFIEKLVSQVSNRMTEWPLFLLSLVLSKLRVVSIILIFLLGFVVDSLSQTLKEFVARALELSTNGKNDQALSLYNVAIKKYHNEPILYVLKGELITKFNVRPTINDSIYNNAVQEFNHAIDIAPAFYQAYSSRGILNMSHQKYQLAIDDFTTVLKLTQGDSDRQFNALADRGNAKLYAKDYTGALQDYEDALVIKPEEVGIQNNLGMLYARLKQYGKAEKQFKLTVAKDPRHLDALNNLAVLYILEEKPKKAIPILEDIIQEFPKEPDLYSNLGLAKIKIGQVDEGMQLINKSLSIYPDEATAYKHRALGFIKLKKINEACEDLKKANDLGYSTSYDNEVNQLIKKHCLNKKSEKD